LVLTIVFSFARRSAAQQIVGRERRERVS
jgi:hypothetical protein